MANPQTITLGASNVNTLDRADYIELTPPNPGPNRGETQVARVFALADATFAGTIAVNFVLGDDDGNVGIVECLLTATTMTKAIAGTGAPVLCKVQFPDGSDKLDLLGASKGGDSPLKWYVGVPAALPAGPSELQLRIAYTDQI